MATQLVPTDSAQAIPMAHATGEQAHFQLMQRKAQLYANSPLIPDALRAGGQQAAIANCYIGLAIAERMGESELTVLQNIHIVKGKAGFSAQFMIARANASGVFKGRINWRMTGSGDTLAAEAYATLADTGEEVSFPVDMAMAKAEGWTSNPKYKSVPHLMLRYRSAVFLVRLYAPEVMFGYQTAEEVEDVAYATAPMEAVQPITAERLLEQAQPEASDAETGEIIEGRADEQHGDQSDGVSEVEADILAHLARKTTAMDVNSLISDRIHELDDEAAQRVRGAAMDRIAEIKGGAK
jgi:hypothetical protein